MENKSGTTPGVVTFGCTFVKWAVGDICNASLRPGWEVGELVMSELLSRPGNCFMSRKTKGVIRTPWDDPCNIHGGRA